MKRFFLLVLFLLISINIFGADPPPNARTEGSLSESSLPNFSLGGGGLFGYTFTRYTLEGGSVESIQNMDRINYAGFIFFDATYAELSVLIQGGNSNYTENMIFDSSSSMGSKGSGYETSLGFSLMGKYPFSINKKFTWFPMIGVEYQIALTQKREPEDTNIVYDRTKGSLMEDIDKNGDPYPISAWNSFWINIGAGLDYYITSSIFLRGEFIFGFRLPTIYENGALEVVENQMNAQNPKLAGLTGGPALKIGIGYRF